MGLYLYSFVFCQQVKNIFYIFFVFSLNKVCTRATILDISMAHSVLFFWSK